MNVNVIDQTILGIDTDHVKRIAMDALNQLAIYDVTAINIVMVDAIPIAPRDGERHTRTVGLCEHVPPYPGRYVIRAVANNEWCFTLRHELYHVYEFDIGTLSNEWACDEFARVLSSVCR